MDRNKKNKLLIDDIYTPVLDASQGEELGNLIDDFIECYAKRKNENVHRWLYDNLYKHLSKIRTKDEIDKMATDIEEILKRHENNNKIIEKNVENGRSKDTWFANEVINATSSMSTSETVEYMRSLDEAVLNANAHLYDTINTNTGNINCNPNLDGFIAEQMHAQSFNMNAEASDSSFRAKVLEPNGQGYAKNSVDIVIFDKNNPSHYVRKYQSKYCKDAASTMQAFSDGNYRGQRKLVPTDQLDEIDSTVADVITAPDGTHSEPLSKTAAKDLQKEAQSGQWREMNWNAYKTKDLAMGIAKNAGTAALMGAAIGAGLNIAQKVFQNKKIKTKEVVQVALESGTDFGIKAAAAGALKVGVEKNIITAFPKGTPAGVLASIAFVGVEHLKTVRDIVNKKLTLSQGLQKMERTTVSTTLGLAAMSKGAALGASIGSFLGPVGSAVGSFTCGTIGYMVGSSFGDKVVDTFRKVRKTFCNKIKTICNNVITGVRDCVKSVRNCISSIFA